MVIYRVAYVLRFYKPREKTQNESDRTARFARTQNNTHCFQSYRVIKMQASYENSNVYWFGRKPRTTRRLRRHLLICRQARGHCTRTPIAVIGTLTSYVEFRGPRNAFRKRAARTISVVWYPVYRYVISMYFTISCKSMFFSTYLPLVVPTQLPNLGHAVSGQDRNLKSRP